MPAKKTSTKSAPAAATKSTSTGSVLKTICATLKIEPKVARRKLRAANLSFHGKRERWVIPASQVAKVKEVLTA